MTTQEAIETLVKYNDWRRGAEMPQPDPKTIGQAIDAAIEALKARRPPRGASLAHPHT